MPSLSEALETFKIVVVTGGSSGIGSSFIRLCQRVGPELVFCNLSRHDPAINLCPKSKKNLNHFPCDLTRPEEVERVAREVEEFLARAAPTGRILLVNNSGVGAFGVFTSGDLQRQLAIVDLNARAVVHLTGLLLPVLRQRGGVVMNVASTLAFQPAPFASTYAATKAFVLHWTMALDEELRGSGLRALAVCPGTTRTDFFRAAGVGIVGGEPRGMTPERVAEEMVTALAKGRGLSVPGLGNRILAFASSHLPKAFAAKMAGRVLRRRRLREEAW